MGLVVVIAVKCLVGCVEAVAGYAAQLIDFVVFCTTACGRSVGYAALRYLIVSL